MAKKPLVKCKYCGISFDREVEEWVQISNRYAHSSCAEKEQEENRQYRKLTDLIQSLYSPLEPDWGLLGQQLKRYREAGMTYPGMYYTLEYFFKVKQNNIHEGRGIGIIPYVYKTAKEYYATARTTSAQAARINNQDKIELEQTDNVIIITPKKSERKLIDFEY